jgi:hypothetical protein
MKILTDDPDWAPQLYAARALAIWLVRKLGRPQPDARLVAARKGLTVTYHPQRSPLLLTIDAAAESAEGFERVLDIEWNAGDAWRVVIETYRPGRWESRLKNMVHPRPWLERWRAMALFTAPAPRVAPPPSRARGRGASPPLRRQI